jgi:hypothetical protein
MRGKNIKYPAGYGGEKGLREIELIRSFAPDPTLFFSLIVFHKLII